ncbi:hypothetical protein [Symbiopectobacterium sp. RP]|uniref:hypothetical protein n=1 Tax=Symbiopectobacterium sp. RP TaxID=3248553 RepID=UPI003D29B1A4
MQSAHKIRVGDGNFRFPLLVSAPLALPSGFFVQNVKKPCISEIFAKTLKNSDFPQHHDDKMFR